MGEERIIPRHIGIIMDGNGRWATARGLSRSMGHKEGAETLKKLCLYMNKIGVPYVSLYAFSTENFKRAKEEVNYLMELFVRMFTKEFQVLNDHNIRVVFSGRRDKLPKKVLKAMDNVTILTSSNTGSVLNICINYGGRSEITDMVKEISSLYKNGDILLDEIDEEFVRHHLYQDLPDLDLLIRTSGEERLSNFMMYQASYAELYFTKTLFPDFLEEELDKAILEFNHRNRRFGA